MQAWPTVEVISRRTTSPVAVPVLVSRKQQPYTLTREPQTNLKRTTSTIIIGLCYTMYQGTSSQTWWMHNHPMLQEIYCFHMNTKLSKGEDQESVSLQIILMNFCENFIWEIITRFNGFLELSSNLCQL